MTMRRCECCGQWTERVLPVEVGYTASGYPIYPLVPTARPGNPAKRGSHGR